MVSLSTKLQGHGSRLMPDRVKAGLHRELAESESATDQSDGQAGDASRPQRDFGRA